ncbi:hypothetical protein V1318_17135, partial [Lysobacter sp. CCNWLW3]|uniref:hypothetical protein n=1 Tax=Lysobacter sp. CCNWLW3 TaxID=3117014 RepID=UPI002FD645A7
DFDVAIHGATATAPDRPARPSLAGRVTGLRAMREYGAARISMSPSMARPPRLRIARPGHPWPGV